MIEVDPMYTPGVQHTRRFGHGACADSVATGRGISLEKTVHRFVSFSAYRRSIWVNVTDTCHIALICRNVCGSWYEISD